jgi:hypothetical protein
MSQWFSSMLAPWQWALLAAVPPAIIALYFLKLRRQPLEVPSTYLWRRTIEDMHVNSIWQRLRQNLLLFLQLLLVALVILACLRPSWRGNTLTGDRFIFLIDTSASMSATDVGPSRLEAAKKRTGDLIEQMKPGDVAMIVSFSDRALVEQPFTDNRRVLRRRLAEVKPTHKTSDIGEALRVAAGLANPGRSGDPAEGDVAAADAMPADLYILTDGGFQSVPDFAMGNLRPVYVPLGEPTAANVGIVAFSVDRNPERADRMHAFGRLENFSDQAKTVEVALYLGQTLVDAQSVSLDPGGTGGVEFVLEAIDEGILRIELGEADDLVVDNVAYAVVNPPRRAKVLFVSPGNDPLELALGTGDSQKFADVLTSDPNQLEKGQYRDELAAGAFDLVIFDQWAPPQMPQANTLMIGRIPPTGGWKAVAKAVGPQIIDTDKAHPLMQFIELGDVRWILNATPLEVPSGGSVLVDSDAGPLLAIAPRDGLEDAVLGFEVYGVNEQGERAPNTDWVIRTSFPLFIRNVLTYLGRHRSSEQMESVPAGKPIALRAVAPVDRVRVETPSGEVTEIPRGPDSAFLCGSTDHLGIYHVREGSRPEVSQRFAVNLFDRVESDIRPRPLIKTQYDAIAGTASWESTRREAWRWIVMLALGVLLVEWFVYNRRVYL